MERATLTKVLETAPPAAECSLTLPYLDTTLPCFVPDRALEVCLVLGFAVNRSIPGDGVGFTVNRFFALKA